MTTQGEIFFYKLHVLNCTIMSHIDLGRSTQSTAYTQTFHVLNLL